MGRGARCAGGSQAGMAGHAGGRHPTTPPPLQQQLTLMGHLAHEVAVAVPRFLLKVPAGHLTGLMVLVLGQYAPAGQGLQARCLVWSWYWPLGHSRQKGCFMSAKKPAAHGLGLTEPAGQAKPGGQAWREGRENAGVGGGQQWRGG